jgi:radical SAM protein with 4Fe4S-binding SPASM domain
MRAARGSFQSALGALDSMHDAGISVAANTNVNRFNQADLEALYDVLRAHHVESWQVQITTPLGRAADRPDMILQPYDLLTLVPRIAALKERAFADGILMLPGNNLGYFGPEEALLRSAKQGGEDHFQGCQAGRFVMGIESQGAVKGCPSLQSAHYVGGNAREKSLREIWDHAPELAFTRARTTEDLWGFCKTCPFAKTCLGGCSFTAHALLGRPGNNPLCHFRARDFDRRGLRERLALVEAAPRTPFDNGLWEIVVEPKDATEPTAPPREKLVQVRRPKKDAVT